MEPNTPTPQDDNNNPVNPESATPPVAPQPPVETPAAAPEPAVVTPTPGPNPTAAVSAPALNFEYISNPFLNAIRGLVDVLKFNPVSILLASLIAVLAYVGIYIMTAVLVAVSPILAMFIILFGLVAIMVAYGAFIHIAGRSAFEETVTTKEAVNMGFKKALPLLGLSLLIGFGVSIGLLLLIIPGVILYARWSLAPMVMFEEKLGISASLKRSAELTKGHVFEMLGSFMAGSFLGSQGLLIGAISVAPLVGRYHDLRQLKESGAPNPKVHWLNYLVLVAIVPVILLVILVSVGLGQHNRNPQNTDLYYNTNTQINDDMSTETNIDYNYDYSTPSQ